MSDTTRATRRRPSRGSTIVAIVLAVGISTALNVLTIGVLVDALFSVSPGLSENATQILTGWGGGVLGVIGAAVGYQVGREHRAEDTQKTDANDARTVQ